MCVSFCISYIAGNLPTIKDYLKRDKTLHDKIDACYTKALKRWTTNDGIRHTEEYRQYQHMEELDAYIAGDSSHIDSGTKDLLLYWADELRNDPVCYDFIMEHKLDVANMKLDAGFTAVINEVQDKFSHVDSKLDSMHAEMQKMMEMMEQMSSNRQADDEEKVTELINSVLNTTINTLIDSLHIKTALHQLDLIEQMFSDILSKNQQLSAKLCLKKGACLSMFHGNDSLDVYHRAYKLAPDDEKCIESEVRALISENHIDEAKELSSKLPTENVIKTYLEIVSSSTPQKDYVELDDKLKSYHLRMMLIAKWGESEETYALLFPDETVTAPETLTYQNVTDWSYILTFYNLKTQGFLQLSNKVPASQEIVDAYNVGRTFNSSLQRTEIADKFTVFKALYCYWGFIVERSSAWLDEFQKIDRNQWKGDIKKTYSLKEASMLSVSGRYEEAFAVIASLKEDFDPNFASFVILLTYHSGKPVYFEWLMNQRAAQEFKLDDESARYIAFCIERGFASDIQKHLSVDAFEKKNNALILNELCQYYNHEEVDVDLIKASLDDLGNEMTAYAAMLLSERGEPELAYRLLSPKVKGSNIDLKQRIFLNILQRIPSEHPKLYKSLQKLRKEGNDMDDGLLQCEMQLDMRLADYTNAYEVAKILYERNPHDEARLCNLILVMGKVCPQDIKNYIEQILFTFYSHFEAVKIISSTLSENGYLEEATEVLYRYVRSSEDWAERTYYYNETSIGPLVPVARMVYPQLYEGLYAVCDLGNGERKIYQAKETNRIGRQLLGMKEDEKKIVEIVGEEKEITVLHILNKYGQLSYEIMESSMSGDNDYLIPGRMDVEHPLESLENLLKKINPNADSYQKELKNRQTQYEIGQIGLCSLVDESDVIGDYYQKLFTQQKIYVGPWQFLLQFNDMVKGEGPNRYVIDLTSLFMLFEFENKTGCYFDGKLIVSKTVYEFISTCQKNVTRFRSLGYHEALKSGNITRFDEYSDRDYEIRCQKLLEWMNQRCEVIVPENALVFEERKEKGTAASLTMDTMSLIVEDNRVLITDDHFIDLHFRGSGKVITTEAFVRRYFTIAAADKYWEYLISCNYVGLFIPQEYILSEYLKMEQGKENKMTYIMQTAAKNYVIYAEVVNSAVNIMQQAKDRSLAIISITNLFTMMIKSFRGTSKAEMVELAMQLLDYPIWFYQKVRQCLADAAKINNLMIA